jgi:hypothetical protein
MRPLPITTHVLAERHEALWLRLAALHKDIAALAAKRPAAAVGDSERILAEGLMTETRPFLLRQDRLPVAAPLLAGLAVQLGQVLAQLEDYENRHAFWDAARGLRCWRLGDGTMPVLRLRQGGRAAEPEGKGKGELREKLARLIQIRERSLFEDGFRKGQAARFGPPADAEDG